MPFKPEDEKFINEAVNVGLAGIMADIANDPEIAGKLSIRDRIIASVRREPKTMVEIAEEIDSTVETVRKTVNRDVDKGRTFTRIYGTDNVYRITLLPTGTEG